MRARLFSHLRPMPATAVAVTVLLFAMTGFVGSATGTPPPGTGKQITIVTLTGGPVAVSTPIDPYNPDAYPMTLSPSSSTSFTQKAGQVVTISMAADFAGNTEALFCDVHAAVDLTPDSTSSGVSTNGVSQKVITQRGGPWWSTLVEARDSTRTIPAPASDVSRTVIGVAWMDDSPNPADPNSCFVDGVPQTITVSVRVSIVTFKP